MARKPVVGNIFKHASLIDKLIIVSMEIFNAFSNRYEKEKKSLSTYYTSDKIFTVYIIFRRYELSKKKI